jgi:hypothetical protein
MRRRLVVAGFGIREEIQPTPFSLEVRRVGILVPGTPRWERTSTHLLFGRPLSFKYAEAVADCRMIIKLLGALNVSDQERISMLESTLIYLRQGDFAQMRVLEERLVERLK